MTAMTIIIGVAGGLGLFLFGMQMCSEGLQKITARRLKHFVKALAKFQILSLGVGALVTLGLQSSSATSALVIGLVSASVLTLAQALGFLLGSAVGSSLTAQIIVFRANELALVLLAIGTGLYMFSKRTKRKSLGQAILGFGMIFFGMTVMSSAVEPIQRNPVLVKLLIELEKFPILELFFGMVVTAVFQSSAAFLALLMTLASHQLIGVDSIIPYVLGAHLGGTLTGIISSFGTSCLDSKRAALANFGFKLINGILFLPFYKPLTALILWSSPNLSREIANAHTLFSLIMAFAFLPFTQKVASLMERILPQKQSKLCEARFLQKNLLEIPELALDQAQRQTIEMGRIIRELMLERFLPLVKYANEDLLVELKETEQAIDSLYKQISDYLAGLGNHRLSEDQMERTMKILYIANDLEHIGDILITIVQLVEKMDQQGIQFSEAGFEELMTMFGQVQESVCLALRAFEDDDHQLATGVIKKYPWMIRLEKEYRYNHFDRMQSGNPQTIETSAVHLDMIEALFRINGHAVNIAQGVLGIV